MEKKKSIQGYMVNGFLAIISCMSLWVVHTVQDHDVKLGKIETKIDVVMERLGIDENAIKTISRK